MSLPGAYLILTNKALRYTFLFFLAITICVINNIPAFLQYHCHSYKEGLTVKLKFLICLTIDCVVDKKQLDHLLISIDPINQWTTLLIILNVLTTLCLYFKPVTRPTNSFWNEVLLNVFKQIVQQGIPSAHIWCSVKGGHPLLLLSPVFIWIFII